MELTVRQGDRTDPAEDGRKAGVGSEPQQGTEPLTGGRLGLAQAWDVAAVIPPARRQAEVMTTKDRWNFQMGGWTSAAP